MLGFFYSCLSRKRIERYLIGVSLYLPHLGMPSPLLFLIILLLFHLVIIIVVSYFCILLLICFRVFSSSVVDLIDSSVSAVTMSMPKQ